MREVEMRTARGETPAGRVQGRGGRRQAAGRRRRRNRPHPARALGLLLVVAAGVAASAYFLFRLQRVEIAGRTQYTAAQIQSAMGVQNGRNLLMFDRAAAAAALPKKLPYIRSAAVELRPFTTLRVTVEPDRAAAAVRDGGSLLIVDSGLKLLETAQKAPDLPVLEGLAVKSRTPGENVAGGDKRTVDCVSALLAAFGQNGLKAGLISGLSVGDPYELKFRYGGRIDIVLGTSSNLSYKIKTALYIIKTQLSATEKGKLDVSRATADTESEHKIYFVPS